MDANGKLGVLMRASVAPGPYGDGYGYGITLRQHFAGLAMQGMLSNSLPCDGITLEEVTNEVAGSAVAYADALLAELSKEHP